MNGVMLAVVLRLHISVGQFPGCFAGGRIIRDVIEFFATFQHECFQAFFAQFLGGPTAGNAGTDDNGIVFPLFDGIYVYVHDRAIKDEYCEQVLAIGS